MRDAIEDVVLNSRPDAADRLLEIAGGVISLHGEGMTAASGWRHAGKRTDHPYALVGGMMRSSVVDDTEELRSRSPRGGRPLQVIEGPPHGRDECRRRSSSGRQDVPAGREVAG
ncbi:MAG: hypothetical protein IPH03_13705 [Tetrasphaera sp.]|nr:hypothetical protein [Tetrasphaera sp.]